MWDERYAGKEYFYGKEPNDFLKDNIDLVKAGDSVLCLAEGEGRNAAFIARSQSSAHVTAVDASKVALEKTKALDMLMQLSELKKELSCLDFKIARECERDVQEGQGHFGLSAVVQVIAQKAK